MSEVESRISHVEHRISDLESRISNLGSRIKAFFSCTVFQSLQALSYATQEIETPRFCMSLKKLKEKDVDQFQLLATPHLNEVGQQATTQNTSQNASGGSSAAMGVFIHGALSKVGHGHLLGRQASHLLCTWFFCLQNTWTRPVCFSQPTSLLSGALGFCHLFVAMICLLWQQPPFEA